MSDAVDGEFPAVDGYLDDDIELIHDGVCPVFLFLSPFSSFFSDEHAVGSHV